MVNLVQRVFSISYFFGRATGLLNFEVDLKTGRIKVTKRATICAACLHTLIFFSMVHQLINTDDYAFLLNHANVFRKTVNLVADYSRIICAFLILVSRWTQRSSIIRLYNSFRRLYQRNPEIILYSKRRFVRKCFCINLVQIVQVIMVVYALRSHLTIPRCVRIWAMFSLTAIVNGITTQYYIAIASIRGRYFLLNKDLEAIVAEIQSLNPNRRGVFMTTCCSLADRLEKIAQSQSELQVLTERLLKTYQVQVMCTVIIYYLNLVGHFFILVSCKRNSFLNIGVVALTAVTAFYLINFWINLFNSFYLLDAHEEMVQLLSQRTLFPPELDQRLEAVIDSFTLNLARNPLTLRFLGLFKIDRFASFALLNSLVTHTIILIQYEIENF